MIYLSLDTQKFDVNRNLKCESESKCQFPGYKRENTPFSFTSVTSRKNLEFPCSNTLVVEWAKAEGQKCHAKTMEGKMILSHQNKKRREPGKKKCHARNYEL